MFAIWRPVGILINYSLNRKFVPFKYLHCGTISLPNYQNRQNFNSFHFFTSESDKKSTNPKPINNLQNSETNDNLQNSETNDNLQNSETNDNLQNSETNEKLTNLNPNDKSRDLENIDINPKNGRYIAVFTCNICNYRSAKSFSKQAYHHGIVYVKCESCNSLHLISDELGWFGEKQNIEEILLKKGEEVSKMELGENVSESDLELIKSLQHNKYFKQ